MKRPLLLLVLISLLCSCADRHNSDKAKTYIKELATVKERLEGSTYNKDYCLLVDFGETSGTNRMFLYNLRTGVQEHSFLVAHGDGCGQKNGTPAAFSNTVGSNCSSIGMAVIGERAYSNYGVNIKYWLDGLDDTNNNMRKRVVVIHSYSTIPDFAITPLPIIQSKGCFTISNNGMSILDEFIKKQENKQLLLYAFKS